MYQYTFTYHQGAEDNILYIKRLNIVASNIKEATTKYYTQVKFKWASIKRKKLS